MVLDEIKKANIQALKDKNEQARTILGIVMNKAMLETIKKREKHEELTDGDVLQIIQKTVKELNEEAENYKKVNNDKEVANIETQKSIIEKFLPKLLSEEEIHNIIAGMEDKTIGVVMRKFKQEYAGQCDMRLVQEVLKKF